MSTRKNSTYIYDSLDNDDTNNIDDLNSAMRMSYNETISESEKNITNESQYGFGTCSVKHSFETIKSTNIMFNFNGTNTKQPVIYHDKDCKTNMEKKNEEPLAAEKKLLHVDGRKSRIISDELSETLKMQLMKQVNDLCNDLRLSSCSDEFNNSLDTLEKVTVGVMDDSNICPALTVLETTLNKSDRDTSKDRGRNHGRKSRIISDELSETLKMQLMKQVNDLCNDLRVSSCSDESNNSLDTLEKVTVGVMDDSNIWPALTVLETTLNKSDKDTSKDRAEMMEKLNKLFNYSPRTFTESLMTIIDESFVATEEIPNGFIVVSNNNEGFKLQEDMFIPKLVSSDQPNDQFTEVSDSTIFHQFYGTVNDSTVGINVTRDTSPVTPVHKNKENNDYRQIPDMFLNRKTPKESVVRCSNKFSPAKCSPIKKIYHKTPGLIRNQKTSKISVTQRLRADSTNIDSASPEINKILTKLPKIVVDPATPQALRSYRKRRVSSIKSCEDEEYLTAESSEEADHFNIEPEEPLASSSIKMDISKVAFHHEEWVQAYEKVSKYKPVSFRKTSSMIAEKRRRLSMHSNKLEKRWLQELQEKRRRCMELVNQILEDKCYKTIPAVEEKSDSCEVTMAFFNTLKACSEYYAYGMNARNAWDSMTEIPRFVSSLSINLSKKENLSPRLSIHHGTKKSPRKSLVKRNTRMKLPGTGCLSPHSKVRPTLSKRRSSKVRGTPTIDRSSIRTVAELRNMFSPKCQAADGRKINVKPKNHMPKTIEPLPYTEGGEMKIAERRRNKFRHVVSPVAQYIKGDSKT